MYFKSFKYQILKICLKKFFKYIYFYFHIKYLIKFKRSLLNNDDILQN